VIISGRRRIVDAEKIHTLATWSLKSDHDAEEIWISFHMRRAQSGRDSANAAMLRARLKKPEAAQRSRQIVRDPENNPAASDLILVRYTVTKFEIRIVSEKFLLDVGDLPHVLANGFQIRCAGPKRTPLTFVF